MMFQNKYDARARASWREANPGELAEVQTIMDRLEAEY